MALVELGRFDRQEAFIVQSRLESEGIMSFVFDAGASIADGSYLLIASDGRRRISHLRANCSTTLPDF